MRGTNSGIDVIVSCMYLWNIQNIKPSFYIILSYILYYCICSEVKTESIKSLLCLFTLLERKQRHNNAGTWVTNKINN